MYSSYGCTIVSRMWSTPVQKYLHMNGEWISVHSWLYEPFSSVFHYVADPQIYKLSSPPLNRETGKCCSAKPPNLFAIPTVKHLQFYRSLVNESLCANTNNTAVSTGFYITHTHTHDATYTLVGRELFRHRFIMSRTAVRKWHSCRLLCCVLLDALPTVSNNTKARKSSCQLRTYNSLFVFAYFNLSYESLVKQHYRVHAPFSFLSGQITAEPYVYEAWVFLKRVWYAGPAETIVCLPPLSGPDDVHSKILKPTQAHHLLPPPLCWLLSENILYIGPLWAQHDCGENTVKTNAWSVELHPQQLPVGVGLTVFSWCLSVACIQSKGRNDSPLH